MPGSDHILRKRLGANTHRNASLMIADKRRKNKEKWGLAQTPPAGRRTNGKITYVEYVKDVPSHPNYDAALKALKAVVT